MESKDLDVTEKYHKDVKDIANWVRFFGVITIIAMIGAIAAAVSVYS